MKLTKTQQKIVKTIKDLYRQNEPLNITAVKRRHPELMQAVYAVKPYWGWKKALEAAGIKYSDIKVELQDYCVCEICKKEFRSLACHIWRKHAVNCEDYRTDYPVAELICEDLRAQRTKMKYKDQAHWEKLWSEEYILDRLWQRYEKKLPLHFWAVFNEGQNMIVQIITRFDSFDNAIKKLGLNPKDIRRIPVPFRTKKEVLAAITQRHRLHLPLNPFGVKKIAEGPLYQGARRFFGSWKKALEAAGLNYEVLKKQGKSRYPTIASILNEIKRRRKLGRLITGDKLIYGEHADAALYLRGRKFFGTWTKALRTAGVPNNEVALKPGIPQKYPSAEAVIAEIQRRQKESVSIRHVDILKGPHSDSALHIGAKRYIGKWSIAVKRAGFPYWKLYPRKHEARFSYHS